MMLEASLIHCIIARILAHVFEVARILEPPKFLGLMETAFQACARGANPSANISVASDAIQFISTKRPGRSNPPSLV
jgi:hypothetical protein